MNKKMMIASLVCIFLLSIYAGVTIGKADDNVTKQYLVISNSNTFIDNQLYDGSFNLDNGTVTGKYINFDIDNSTGVVTNYSLKYFVSDWRHRMTSSYRTAITYDSSHVSRITFHNPFGNYEPDFNFLIFKSITVEDFKPIGIPMVSGYNFTFSGKNQTMMFQDLFSGYARYFPNSDMKITFEVADGFNISSFPAGGHFWIDIDLSPSSVWHIRLRIYVEDGQITINDQMIEVDLRAQGRLHFFVESLYTKAWYDQYGPGYNEYDKLIVQEAENNGLISAEAWCSNTANYIEQSADEQDSTQQIVSHSNIFDDPSFTMDLESQDNKGIDYIVHSDIPTGRIVIINIQENVLPTMSPEELQVLIDSFGVEKISDLSSLMQKAQNGDSDAAYYYLTTDQLITFFVYVPHFSTHTISINTIASTVGEVTNILLPFVFAMLFIVLSVAGVLIQKKKKQDDF